MHIPLIVDNNFRQVLARKDILNICEIFRKKKKISSILRRFQQNDGETIRLV